MNSTRQFLVLFLLFWVSSAAQARFELPCHDTEWQRRQVVTLPAAYNAQAGMASVNEHRICTTIGADKVGVLIHVSDLNGNHNHLMKYLAVKVEFALKDNPKIGTIVITDLRLGDIPASAGLVHTMSISDLNIGYIMAGWTVSNSFGQSYSGNDSEFYICIADGKISIKI